jgi:hypothetical protein
MNPFSGPNLGKVPEPPPMPSLSVAGARQEQSSMLKRRRGRAASILAGNSAPQTTATKTLLGQ